MAAAYELFDSRAIRFDPSNPGVDMKFLVTGAADSDAAAAAVQPTATYRFAGFTRLPYSADAKGAGVWAVTVPYGVPQAGAAPALFPGETLGDADRATDPSIPDMTDPFAGMPDGTTPFDDYPDSGSSGADSPHQPASDTDPLGAEWGFDTTGGTKTIKLALLDEERGGLPSRYFGRRKFVQALGGDVDDFGGFIRNGVHQDDADDFGGLIGVKEGDKGKLEVEGKELADPKLDLTTTRTVKGISLAYIRLVAEMTGTVNGKPWGGAEAGELLFLGASGQYKPGTGSQAGAWTITYRFAYAPNRYAEEVDESWPSDDPRRLGLQVAEELYIPPGETLEGWDMLDVLFRDQKHPTIKRIVPTATQFAIHRVYPRTDFQFLGFRNFNF